MGPKQFRLATPSRNGITMLIDHVLQIAVVGRDEDGLAQYGFEQVDEGPEEQMRAWLRTTPKMAGCFVRRGDSSAVMTVREYLALFGEIVQEQGSGIL